MLFPARKQIRQNLLREGGFALVLALAILVVFGIAATAVIQFTVANQHASSHSNATSSAVSLAQAGIDNAVSQITKSSETNCNSVYCAVIDGNWAPLRTGTTVNYENGSSVTYSGTLQNTVVGTLHRYIWKLTSTGRLRNPNQPGDVTRTVHADVYLGPKPTQTLTTQAWEYIYSKRTGTPGGCDQSVYNNANVQSSMYVSGNLCLNTPSSILGPQKAGDPAVKVIVNGWVNLDVNTNIGTSAKPLSAVHIKLGCKFAGTADPGPPLGPSPICRKMPAQSYDQVYNSDTSVYSPNTNKQSDTVIPTISPPLADFLGWYAFAQPGPAYPCYSSVGTPPQFDNNQTNDYAIGGSIPAVVSLTPAAAYDCWTPGGELAWLPESTDPPSNFPKGSPGLLTRQPYGQLYLKGTMYIDGSATVDATVVRYRGNGAVYLSGTFLVKNSVFCAILSANLKSCDTQAWETSSNPDIFVVSANGDGSAGGAQGQVPTGDSVEYKSSNGQGALYATKAVEIDTTSQFQGPMVAQTEVISQTGGSPFPIFLNVPFGTPGNGIAGYEVLRVANYNG